MKAIVIISMSNKNSPNGASKFVNLFHVFSDEFNKKGIKSVVISNDQKFDNAEQYQKSLTFKKNNFIKNILHKTFFGQSIEFYLTVIRNAKKVINKALNQYGELILSKETLVILNDLYTAYYFIKSFPNKEETVFMVHNSGNLQKMVRITFSKELFFTSKYKFSKLEQTVIYQVKRLIFVSNDGEKQFLNTYPNLSEHLCTISIGQPSHEENFNKNISNLRIISVGSICERKNQIGILHVLQKIKDKSITLTLVGDGLMRQECENFAKKYEMSEQVTFLGSKNSVFEYLDDANLFVLFSKDEGLPIAAQEAMNASLPLIITDVGGCKELVLNNNGFCINVNEAELEEKLLFFNENKDLLKIMGKNSKELFESKYSIMKMIENYINLYYEVVNT